MATTQRTSTQLGPTPGKERLTRGERKTRDELDRVGFGVRETAEVTIPATSSAKVAHGLGALPEFVAVTPLESPAAFAVTARGRDSVTLRNDEADPRTFWVAFYG